MRVSINFPISYVWLTLFNRKEFPIHIDTIRIELSTLYFKGSYVEISIKLCISVPDDSFNLSKQCRF